MQNIKFDLYFILDFYIFRNYQKCLLFKLKPFGSFLKIFIVIIGFSLLQSRRNKGLKEIKFCK